MTDGRMPRRQAGRAGGWRLAVLGRGPRRLVRRWITVLPCLAALCLATAAGAGEWQVDTKAKDHRVVFTSRVVTFNFEGTTDRVDGYIYWEGDTLFADKAQLLFEVDMASLDTGIGKRDRDLRDVLNTRKWPKARYQARITGHTRLDTTVTAYQVESEGTFTLHGVDRKMKIPATIFVEDGVTRVRSSFQLRLEDFDIEAPSLAAFVKVSQEIDVAVNITMKHVK